MTEISDSTLAIAVNNAGGVGSISPGKTRDLKWYNYECERFTKEVNHNIFVLALPLDFLLDSTFKKETYKLVLKYSPHCLLLLFDGPLVYKRDSLIELRPFLYSCKKNNINLVGRHLNLIGHSWQTDYKAYRKTTNEVFSFYDYITLKGSDSAGYAGTVDSLTILEHTIKHYPNNKFIATGGIYSKEAIETHLNAGAYAVEIGSIFALSKESSLSERTKKRVFEDLKNKNFHISKADKTGQLFYSPKGAFNLYNGATGNIDEGHIFLGKKLSTFNIEYGMSVEEIMKVLL